MILSIASASGACSSAWRKIGFVQEFGDVGQCVKVLLKLALRHEEQHDELHRLIVERVKAHARL